MRELLWVENTSEIDRRHFYLCIHCHGPVLYQKPYLSKKYEWICNKCNTKFAVEDLKIKIGEQK